MIRDALWVCLSIPCSLACSLAQAQDRKDLTVISESKATTSIDATDGGKYLEPLLEDEVFFTAPEQRKTVQSAPKKQSPEAKKRKELRLLGVGRVGRSESDETHAILRVDGEQIYRRIGESVGEIEIIDIGKRSITLQSDGDRWTIELFEQPILEANSVSNLQPRPSRSNAQRQTRRSTVSKSDSISVTSQPVMPTAQTVAPISPIDAPAMPEMELPPLPQLPDFSNVQ